jgi:hypothetical protein
MAHFAEIDESNLVIRVLVTDNNELNEGYDWLIQTFGGKWVKTSYNSNIRKNFAGIGFTYDEALDAFLPPKPFESWVLDEATCQWQAPISYPTDGFTYYWDESSVSWVLENFAKPDIEIE